MENTTSVDNYLCALTCDQICNFMNCNCVLHEAKGTAIEYLRVKGSVPPIIRLVSNQSQYWEFWY